MDPGRRIRSYGDQGPTVIALHGGPGACGGAGRVASALASHFRVLEPWQRTSGGAPLTVADHVEDLHRLICGRCPDGRPALVGESWGAMLALAYAAAYPDRVGPIALVGCGCFDGAARDVIVERRRERIAAFMEQHPEHRADLQLSFPEQMMKWHGMTDTFEAHPEPVGHAPVESFDRRGHEETWSDMVRCQQAGIYPVAFSVIETSVAMFHGDYDPHPGEMIHRQLVQLMPQLEYAGLERCGRSSISPPRRTG